LGGGEWWWWEVNLSFGITYSSHPRRNPFFLDCLSVGVVSEIQKSITNQQTTLPDIPEGARPYFKKL
jgi:hypothetical protein